MYARAVAMDAADDRYDEADRRPDRLAALAATKAGDKHPCGQPRTAITRRSDPTELCLHVTAGEYARWTHDGRLQTGSSVRHHFLECL